MSTTTPKTYKVKVAMTLIKSQNVYKGPFETADELNSVQALNGDYADVYETGTRWQYVNDTWTNTGDPIPVDKQYAQSKDVSVLSDGDTIVKRDEDGHVYATDGTALQHVVTVKQLQDTQQDFESKLDDEENARINAVNDLQKKLDEEVSRSTGKDASLEQSIHGLDDDIIAEETRAQAAEKVLQQNIDSTNTSLSEEVNRAKTVENANTQAIEAEQNGRIASYNQLSQDIQTEASTRQKADQDITKSVNNEISRAQKAEETLSDEVETKLTKVTDTNERKRAYIINTSGAQETEEIDAAKTAGTLVERTSTGQVKAADPNEDDDAATKKYVDDVDAVHRQQITQLQNELTNESDRAQTAEGVLADSIDTEQHRATLAEQTNAAKIKSNETAIQHIDELIPNAATKDNQLADKDFVNSSIANNASNYVTATESGDTQFSSLSALQAGPWYLRGQSYIPTRNDYAMFINTDNSVWRAIYDGQFWVAVYKVNDTPFTAAQIEAINSGVTANLLANIASDIAKRVVTSALASVLYGTDVDGNQITKAISDFATALQGQKADTAYQKPSSGIPETDLTNEVQEALALARTALQSFTEQDPTVPAWAKASSKPAYTKSEVGLGNVDNTSDMNKPVSTAQQAAIDAVQDGIDQVENDLNEHTSNKSNPHGVTASQVGAEPAFTKNTAFNKNFGTDADTVCQGNDARLSDARTPVAHASSGTKYGAASNTQYGHTLLSGNDTDGVVSGESALRYRYNGGMAVDLNNYRSEGMFTLYNITSRTNFPSGATVTSTPSYHLEVKRFYSNTAVVQVLYVRETTEVWIRYSTSATSWGGWTKLGGSDSPYVTNLSTLSWSGSSGAYTYTINASTHGKGAYPQVRTFVSNEECYDSPTIDASGNVTLKSNEQVAMRVVIY